MPVLDLYLPDDLPIAADADLGRALALVVDAATGESTAPCLVYVHRLPVFGVVSAEGPPEIAAGSDVTVADPVGWLEILTWLAE